MIDFDKKIRENEECIEKLENERERGIKRFAIFIMMSGLVVAIGVLYACGQGSSSKDVFKPKPLGIPWECRIENNANAPTTVIWWIDEIDNLIYENNYHQSCGTIEFSVNCHIKQCSATWLCADYLTYYNSHVQLEFKRELTGDIPDEYWTYIPLPEECDEYGADWIIKSETISIGQCDERCL